MYVERTDVLPEPAGNSLQDYLSGWVPGADRIRKFFRSVAVPANSPAERETAVPPKSGIETRRPQMAENPHESVSAHPRI
jgi:hypothetical protein